jgi:hypothetical protein
VRPNWMDTEAVRTDSTAHERNGSLRYAVVAIAIKHQPLVARPAQAETESQRHAAAVVVP